MSQVCKQCGATIERSVWEGDWHYSWCNELCGSDDCDVIPLQNGDFERLFPMHEKRFRIESERGITCPVCNSWTEMRWTRDSKHRICYVCKYKEDV